jgi:2-polyprenyl-3-methyl-5-hydroxy-6-metoxy-1,4-benzoquinol methylase
MFAILEAMFDYRKTLYRNYYKEHSSRVRLEGIKSGFDQQVRYFKREITPLLKKDKSIKILDLGCGTGSLLAALKSSGYTDIIGIDISEDQLRVAAEVGVSETIQGDILDHLKAHPSHYDVITGIDIIEHFSKDELVHLLELVKQALKDNGQAVVRTPNMDSPFSSVYAHADFTHECFLNKSSAIQVMQAVGFDSVEVSPGLVYIENPIKELIRKILWACTEIHSKLVLFASGRTWHDVVFEPNILISVKK